MGLEQQALALALRKQRLQIQCGLLRERLASQGGQFTPALAAVDRASEGVRWLRAHPLVPLAALLAVLIVRPRRSLRLVRRSLVAWGLVRRTRVWLDRWLQTPAAAPPPRR